MKAGARVRMGWVGMLVLGAATAFCAQGEAQAGAATGAVPWVASWATSQQAPEPQNNQPGVDAAKLNDVTVRQIVHLSVGGRMLRVHFSNAFGTQPLLIDAASVGLGKAGSGAVAAGSLQAVMFAGENRVLIPAGAEWISDPVAMPVGGGADVVVSFHLPKAPAGQTGHPGSRATSFLAQGNRVMEPDLAGAEKIVRWLQISELDVPANGGLAGTVVTFGDSITDGHGATTDGNDRWPDVMAARLQASAKFRGLGVANEGIGGNHLLTDGLGVSALARMDRDVLAVAGVRWVVLFEGINDVGMLARGKNATAEEHAVLVHRMIAAQQQILDRAHAHGLKVIGATITPFVGSDYYAPTPANEADRQAVNAWIRAHNGAGGFDAVADLDKLTRDPADPTRLLPAYDSGDHLHPGPAGYKAMGTELAAVFERVASVR